MRNTHISICTNVSPFLFPCDQNAHGFHRIILHGAAYRRSLKLMVTCAWTAPMEFHSQAAARPQCFVAAFCLHISRYQCLQGILTLSTTILCPRCACYMLVKACTPHIQIQPALRPLLFLASLLVCAMAACLLLFSACWVSAKSRSIGFLGLVLLRADSLSCCSRPKGSEDATLLVH